MAANPPAAATDTDDKPGTSRGNDSIEQRSGSADAEPVSAFLVGLDHDVIATEEERNGLNEMGSGEISTILVAQQPMMSVSKYNQWTIVEANRHLAEKVRQEEAALQRRRAESTAAYHAVRKSKTSVGRGQMELTTGAVREYRGSLALRGAAGKQEVAALKEKALRQKEEWAAHGARSAALHGLEQKKRVLESRAERFQARRNAALATRQDTELRKAAAREIMDKSLIGGRTREGLAPTKAALAEAREFFLKQKRDAASEVRKAERGWLSARKREVGRTLERAGTYKAQAMDARKNAACNRAAVAEEKAAAVREVKTRMQIIESDRQQIVIATAQNSRSSLKEAYDKKFVSVGAATVADSSEYGLLLQRTRNPNMGHHTSQARSSTPLLSVQRATSIVSATPVPFGQRAKLTSALQTADPSLPTAPPVLPTASSVPVSAPPADESDSQMALPPAPEIATVTTAPSALPPVTPGSAFGVALPSATAADLPSATPLTAAGESMPAAAPASVAASIAAAAESVTGAET